MQGSRAILLLLLITATFLRCSSGLLPLGSPTVLSFVGIRAARADVDSVRLDWERVSGVSAYVSYKIENGIPTELATSEESASSFTVTGLTKNMSYTFRVRARDANGKTDENTNDVTVTTSATADLGNISPSTTQDLLAHWRASLGITKDEASTVTLWADQSGNGHDLRMGNPTFLGPTWTPNAANGWPVLRIGDVGRALTNDTLSFADYPSTTLFIALDANTIGGPTVHHLLRSKGVAPLGFSLLDTRELFLSNYGGDQGAYDVANLDYFVATYEVTEISPGDYRYQFWVNGQPDSGPVASGIILEPGVLFGENSLEYVAEIMLFDRVLDDAEREEVIQFLTERYLLLPPP